jgi:hypothetical protein
VAYVALPSVFNVSVLLVVVMAGFQVSIDGRFWVFTEAHGPGKRRLLCSTIFVTEGGEVAIRERWRVGMRLTLLLGSRGRVR